MWQLLKATCFKRRVKRCGSCLALFLIELIGTYYFLLVSIIYFIRVMLKWLPHFQATALNLVVQRHLFAVYRPFKAIKTIAIYNHLQPFIIISHHCSLFLNNLKYSASYKQIQLSTFSLIKKDQIRFINHTKNMITPLLHHLCTFFFILGFVIYASYTFGRMV